MKNEIKKTAIIIGAGPGGLTAAYELQSRSEIETIVLEKLDVLGGISRTVKYKGNRIDIGGHRFFSKSNRVNEWWGKFMRIENGVFNTFNDDGDEVMLNRERHSRILYLRKLFEYPIKMDAITLKNLGFWNVAKISLSYLKVKMFPIKHENNLEEFFINRFGKTLYNMFFKDYTEKVWGQPCREIKSDWGAQRIKGLSFRKVISHAIKTSLSIKYGKNQKNVETSLIDRFLYPKFGPGQLWEIVGEKYKSIGGTIITTCEVISINWLSNDLICVKARNSLTGIESNFVGNILISTMPLKDLINSMIQPVPQLIREVANGLAYRDFITVGLLLKKIKISGNQNSSKSESLPNDNWIYIQESDVKLGRLQIFNNWSPYLVASDNTVWVGLEYFCNEGDEMWSMPDKIFIDFAISELKKLGMVVQEDVLDSTIIRVPKAYPAYFGSYDKIVDLQDYLSGLKNIYPVGRNGMHKYNNQDHSMLTAMTSVDHILSEEEMPKKAIWDINTEQDYHEGEKLQ